MKLVLSGATGLIGRKLLSKLPQHDLYVLVRKKGAVGLPQNVRELLWDGVNAGEWSKEVDGADAVINLSGENIAGKRWGAQQKKILLASRVNATNALVNAIAKAQVKPKTLLNASAIGIYGARDASPIDENASHGYGFLAETCRLWENAALEAEKYGIRVVLLRTGVVLEPSGGALGKMLPPFRLGLGGPLGSGKQGMSWIHIEDEVDAITACLNNSSIKGAVNLTAPQPVSMKEFSRILGKTLHRPAVAPVPGPVLKILLGEMSEMLLTGQYVIPKKLLAAGFSFKYPDLQSALTQLLAKRSIH